MGDGKTAVLIGHSRAADPVEAVRELSRSLLHAHTELVVFFCSNDYDLDAIAGEVNRRFAGVKVVGCTTAGEIGPLGYLDGTLCGLSFSSADSTAVSGRIDDLQGFVSDSGEALVDLLLGRLETLEPTVQERGLFAFQLIDGLFAREESVSRVFQSALGNIPVVGGSAADAGEFARTLVFDQGDFHEDGAVLVVAATSLPFTTFYTENLAGTDRRAVVTAVDSDGRTVKEIDGLPAVEGYARLFGPAAPTLGPSFFGEHPVVVRISGADYARGVRTANPDGSLTFQCAMEEGIVLRAAERKDVLPSLEAAFARLHGEIGSPSAVLACDCLHRKMEIKQLGLDSKVAELFRRENVVGFSGYGGQFHGIHMNQALTGIAFGERQAT